MNNVDRIFAEIQKESERLAPDYGFEDDKLVALVMEIVDLEDQNRTRSLRIRQLVEELIVQASVTPQGGEA